MEKIKEWTKRMVKDILKEADIQDEEVEQIVRKIISKYIQIV
jgi:predicted metal-binding transcription factor (methanogenesis marker protein 9)